MILPLQSQRNFPTYSNFWGATKTGEGLPDVALWEIICRPTTTANTNSATSFRSRRQKQCIQKNDRVFLGSYARIFSRTDKIPRNSFVSFFKNVHLSQKFAKMFEKLVKNSFYWYHIGTNSSRFPFAQQIHHIRQELLLIRTPWLTFRTNNNRFSCFLFLFLFFFVFLCLLRFFSIFVKD